jgi:hypothetical protein
MLILHWIDCVWYITTSAEETWFPPKDLDSKITNAYTATRFTRYNIFFYYAAITLVGSEIIPSDQMELIIATLLIFVSTIFIGMVIGEFASLLSSITKKERLKSDEVDIISTVMFSLRLSERLQDRVFEFYYDMNEAQYIQNPTIYQLINPNLTHHLKMYQINASIKEISFLSFDNLNEIEAFSRELEL